MELMLGVLLVVVGPLILAQIVLAIGAGIHRMSNSGTKRQTKDIDEGLSLDYLWLQRLNNTLDGNKKPSKKRNY
jgi:hypothetical protein